MDIDALQGGASLSALSLVALGLVNLDLRIPEESVGLDKTGQRKLGLDVPKVMRKRPTTIEKGPDGKRVVKRGSRKRRPDSDDEDQPEDSKRRPPFFRKFVTSDCPLTDSAKLSLQKQQRFIERQQRASPVAPPAQGKRTEQHTGHGTGGGHSGSVTDSHQSADTAAIRDCEMETPSLPTSGDAPSAANAIPSGRNPASQHGQGASATTSSVHTCGRETVLSLPSTHVRFRSTGVKKGGVEHLPNFVAWVASSCLMTLARTSYIHRLNLMVADCSISRHFSLVPMRTHFCLKNARSQVATDKDKADPTLHAQTSPSLPKSSSLLKSPTTEQQTRPVMEERPVMDTGTATPTEQDSSLSQARDNSSEGQQSKDPEGLNKAPKTSVDSNLGPEGGPNSSSVESQAAEKNVLSNFGDVAQYKDLIRHLETTFQPDELDRDISQAELVALLPSHLVDKGLKLYSLIDAAGEMGLDERDVQ
ncbi:hypothetical protein EGW08_016894, partial [Elysia chlorotica]